MGIENLAGQAGFLGDHSLPLMGIENPGGAGRNAYRGRSHYPSWGSKTRADDPRRSPAPHYPSWGSKTASASHTLLRSARVSLPLMGIENPALCDACGRVCSLPLMGIENKRRAANDARVLGSLPLMGIENPSRWSNRPSSLPLMGIENTSAGSPSMISARCSLPLMGIENRSTRLRIRAFHLGSLPLMGIENQGRAARRPCASGRLITPHGDRKRRARTEDLLPSVTTSLPLMGIENPRPCCRSASRPISLPLMGIENTLTTRLVHTSGQCSLPLMGIENHRQSPPSRPVAVLITPHGDRKLGRRGPAHSPGAHYPSWGSKTAASPAWIGDAVLITPHGDRKRDLGAVPQAVLRLITPHGDRKLITLITPHGDRKLALSAANCLITPHGDRKRRAGGHYPSWGSKTSQLWRALIAAARAHYPSWGSKTGKNAPFPASAHYPSWGSKTDARRPSFSSNAHYPSWGSKTLSDERT